MRAAGTHKTERVITSPQGARVSVASLSTPVLNMCANNYLGLSNHPALVAAAKESLDARGFGLSSVRFICGTQDIHKRLEARIAAFHGMEDAILFPSCFDANAGIFEAILKEGDAVISDEKNHASISACVRYLTPRRIILPSRARAIRLPPPPPYLSCPSLLPTHTALLPIVDGIRLCKATRLRYKHRDMADLEAQLITAKDARIKLIVTDGVFSMDGTVAPLPEIVALAKKYGASTFVDECHATGFFGATGRGTDEHTGTFGKIDIINSTLGKALGGATGGYTAGSRELVDVLRNKARPYLFSNSIAPSIVAASLVVFDMLERDASHVAKLRALTHRWRDGLARLGFTVSGDRDHPICPVMLGDARLAAEFADEMLKRGVYVVGFSYPVVPKGAARIRTQISSALTEADIDFALKGFAEVGKAKGVIN